MKIATWNVGRPAKTGERNALLIETLDQVNADILILTETNESLNIGGSYHRFTTNILTDHYYNEGERRTIIYSRYPVKQHFETFSGDTSICVEAETPQGNLIVYGTVIGSHGNRNASFNEDLNRHLSDFEKIYQAGAFCISGDFNTSFCDNYYNMQYGRTKLKTAFDKFQLTNLTADLPGNIDHIVVSNYFMENKMFDIDVWNQDKKLSDHIGVLVTILS